MAGIIVVGVDGSQTAKKAAESAWDLAAALGASLHVVSAFDSDRTVPTDEPPSDARPALSRVTLCSRPATNRPAELSVTCRIADSDRIPPPPKLWKLAKLPRL